MTYPPPLYHGPDGEISAGYRPDGTEPELVYPNGTRVHYLCLVHRLAEWVEIVGRRRRGRRRPVARRFCAGRWSTARSGSAG